MTRLQIIHHVEQVDAARHEFQRKWRVFAAANPSRHNRRAEIIAWKQFVRDRGLEIKIPVARTVET
jgi:hypothetical protein